jgi:endonuclease G, mitochondrial
MSDLLARLKAANLRVQDGDRLLREELLELRDSVSFVAESAIGPNDSDRLDRSMQFDGQDFVQETIVLRTGRPVLTIAQNKAQLVFTDVESKVWLERLTEASSYLVKAAKAVGRIEVEGHGLEWLGTGWLVQPDVIVTNRHVAAEFGRRSGTGFVFRQGLHGRAMSASIDFLEEVGSQDSWTFSIEQILSIEEDPGPDIAFLRVRQRPGESLPEKIDLAPRGSEGELVVVIGYPARDSRVPDQALMEKIFGQVYDKKRLAPGQLTQTMRGSISHDCSTLGGNSGSVVLSLSSGQAVGLHFAGKFLATNFAVPSATIQERLNEVLSGGGAGRHARPIENDLEQTRDQSNPGTVGKKFSYLIPLRVTVEIDEPQAEPGSPSHRVQVHSAAADDPEEVVTESVPEDYRDRKGYIDDFLGTNARVPLPEVLHGDVLTFHADGKTEHVLPYEHFSVRMSKKRRLCLFSAVNIDGTLSKPMPRVAWRTDPRIPISAQLRNGCYGAPPRFSRGHMTRREDPIWGTDASAKHGNQDSMHVTNSVPQMQPFNAGVWLELENYALHYARRDGMKISVFTGPFLADGDPSLFGVQIPVEFWKVITFIHDETDELCATGYSMSQRDFLREEEFVYGRHRTAQRSIAWIESRAGLSFGLSDQDPFQEQEGRESELVSLRQIQFLKGA